MLQKVQKYLKYGAAAVFILLLFFNYLKDSEIKRLTALNTSMDKDLKARITISGPKVIYQTRTVTGEVKTVVKYLPPEGSADISQNVSGDVSVKVKRAGFTFRPALFGLVGREAQPGIGARLVYFGRYGAGAGIGLSNNIEDLQPFAFVDRRIDDLVPFTHNTTAGIFGGYQHQAFTVGGMVAVYF